MVSRTKNILKNSSITFIIQIITILLQFAVQTFFIRKLGVSYAGLNTLFLNIISILSICELGIGNSISFSLYKPLSANNYKKVLEILNMFKDIYNKLGVLIFILGLFIIPFLQNIVQDYYNYRNLKLYFLLFVINASVSYFFSYKRILLIANQKTYVNNINIFIFTIFRIGFQIFSLFYFNSFEIFLFIQIIFTLISNIAISLKVDKIYSYTQKRNKYKLPKKDFQKIKKDTIALLGSKIAGIVVSNSGSIFISTFSGVSTLGIFSSYQLITNSISRILNQVFDSITSVLGNLAVENDKEKIISIFSSLTFITWIISYFISILFLILINPFLYIWLGENYTFYFYIVFLIILNYYVTQNRRPLISFIQSFGLFKANGIRALIEAGINIVVTSILVVIFNLGLVGVLLGILIVNISINLWSEPYIIFKYGLGRNLKSSYFAKYFTRLCLTFITAISIRFLTLRINLLGNTLPDLLISSLFTFIIASLFLIIICFTFFRKDLKETLKLLKKLKA